MGTGAGTNAVVIEIISPRVEMTKKDPKKEVVLDSIPLSDVGHGTIHYRYQTPGPSVHDPPSQDKSQIPTGYFFHPKLKDYRELGDPENEEAHKFVRVASGPNRYENQNVYYVSGLGFQSNNNELPPALLSLPDGKHSKKIHGHKYFVITCDKSEQMETSTENSEGLTVLSEKEMKMSSLTSDTVKDVRRRLGHQFLCPLAIVHVLSAFDEELKDEHTLGNIFGNSHNPDHTLTLLLTMQ